MLRFLAPLGRNGAALGVMLVLAHCGGSDLTLPGGTGPVAIAKLDGDNQSGPAGNALPKPLIVQVADRQGNPLARQRVAFSLEQDVDGAQVTPADTTTNSEGKAQAQWTLGATSGTQAVIATVVGSELTARFQATVGSSAPQRIELLSGDGQSSAAGTPLDGPLVVRVTDQFGNPVADVAVDWSAGSGDVNPNSSMTGPDGQASTTWVLGTSTGQQSATAESNELEGSPVTFTATATPGSANRLQLVSGNHQSAEPGRELSDPVVVRLSDREGNGISNRAVSWVTGVGGGAVASPTSATDGNGEAQMRWTLGPGTGLNTLNAVVSGVGVVGFSATATGGGGGGGGGGDGSSASRIAYVVQPSDTEKDRSMSPPVQIEVLDQNGDRVTAGEFEIKLELTGDHGKLKGHKSEKTRSGLATFDEIRIDEEGDYRLRASTDGLPSIESNDFRIRDHDDD